MIVYVVQIGKHTEMYMSIFPLINLSIYVCVLCICLSIYLRLHLKLRNFVIHRPAINSFARLFCGDFGPASVVHAAMRGSNLPVLVLSIYLSIRQHFSIWLQDVKESQNYDTERNLHELLLVRD